MGYPTSETDLYIRRDYTKEHLVCFPHLQCTGLFIQAFCF